MTLDFGFSAFINDTYRSNILNVSSFKLCIVYTVHKVYLKKKTKQKSSVFDVINRNRKKM